MIKPIYLAKNTVLLEKVRGYSLCRPNSGSVSCPARGPSHVIDVGVRVDDGVNGRVPCSLDEGFADDVCSWGAHRYVYNHMACIGFDEDCICQVESYCNPNVLRNSEHSRRPDMLLAVVL